MHDAADDITTGVLPVARGGTGYGSIDATPTSGSDKVVKSSGVHKRIAYKKVTLIPSGWSAITVDNNVTGYSQAIATGNDITANTEIVSVKLAGDMLSDNTTLEYTDTFTGDDSTKEFTLAHTPSVVTEVTNGGVETQNYTVSGNKITMTTAPNNGITLSVTYQVIYDNDIEFSKIRDAETGASVLTFTSYSQPLASLTLVVGYVSETLETLSTQASAS